MKETAFCLTILLLLTSFAGCFGEDVVEEDETLEEVRLNHLRMKGTHNSYHEKTIGVSTITPENNYTHANLSVQADRLGVRQFELDVHFIPGMGLRVFHTNLDPSTNCLGFSGCMQVLLDWSNANQHHAPLWIFVEPKDEPFLVEELDILNMIQEEINKTWPAEQQITPADVQGDATDLRTAITTVGWPTLEESRGKVIFVLLDKTDIRDYYVSQNPTLENQSMFAIVEENHSLASVISFVNPDTHGERLRTASELGFMVRTRPDEATIEAREINYTRFDLALETGANFITTDFPGSDLEVGFSIWLPEGPVMCNPQTAPANCATRDIEPWGNYTPISIG
ncbi:MAG: Ca2+-dependent phosphoinositide-specific phospholipase C [Candidatus Thermoplasmatota archaeon]|nr:Ca2+-dependent phosphoinositide-specific phospholipase C [Candidatus Thermoplasmatota archaeon]